MPARFLLSALLGFGSILVPRLSPRAPIIRRVGNRRSSLLWKLAIGGQTLGRLPLWVTAQSVTPLNADPTLSPDDEAD